MGSLFCVSGAPPKSYKVDWRRLVKGCLQKMAKCFWFLGIFCLFVQLAAFIVGFWSWIFFYIRLHWEFDSYAGFYFRQAWMDLYKLGYVFQCLFFILRVYIKINSSSKRVNTFYVRYLSRGKRDNNSQVMCLQQRSQGHSYIWWQSLGDSETVFKLKFTFVGHKPFNFCKFFVQKIFFKKM